MTNHAIKNKIDSMRKKRRGISLHLSLQDTLKTSTREKLARDFTSNDRHPKRENFSNMDSWINKIF